MTGLVIDPNSNRLPIGRHRADLATLKRVFVDEAPHAELRAQIFSAFTVWVSQIHILLPEYCLWVNGGFVTHKAEPPADIDVVVFASQGSIDAFPKEKRDDLFTKTGSPRRQPMGGLVDAFLSDPCKEQRRNWYEFWGLVKDPITLVPAPGQIKGFVEVIL